MVQLSTSWELAFIVARIKILWKKTKKLRQKLQKTLSIVLFCQSLNAYYSFITDDLALGELSTRGISTGGLALVVLSTKGLAQTSMRSIPSHKTPRPHSLGKNIMTL